MLLARSANKPTKLPTSCCGEALRYHYVQLTFRTLFRSSEAILEEPPEERGRGAIHGLFPSKYSVNPSKEVGRNAPHYHRLGRDEARCSTTHDTISAFIGQTNSACTHLGASGDSRWAICRSLDKTTSLRGRYEVSAASGSPILWEALAKDGNVTGTGRASSSPMIRRIDARPSRSSPRRSDAQLMKKYPQGVNIARNDGSIPE